jgi:glycosyltransferase involved in cell wall biosynthesis
MTNPSPVMQSPLPGVCVIVPVFNREELIPYAIQSLQAETGVDLEIVVADDGSCDGTAAVVASMADADPRIRLLRCNHRGVAAARNKGLREAHREFVTFLDSDDLCAPGRLGRQISKLIANPELDAVIGHRLHFKHEPGAFYPTPSQIVNRNIDICLASGMFRRSLFAKFQGFDENLSFGEDLDFYWRLLESDCLFLIETEAAVYYRLHGGNMTRDNLAMHRALLKAHHNSWVRRRAKGREGRIDVFFFRNFETETLFGGRQPDSEPAGNVHSIPAILESHAA